MKACPKCKSVSRHRLRRKQYVRLIPGSKTYSCDKCNTTYTYIPIFNSCLRL